MDRKSLVITSPNRPRPVVLTAEIAVTDEQCDQGLMFRQSLPANDGMLFVFAEDQEFGFWMKDTYIPLTVAYIDRGGVIVELADLEPLSEETHYPQQPYRYALEVNRGWFRRHGLGVGSRIQWDG